MASSSYDSYGGQPPVPAAFSRESGEVTSHQLPSDEAFWNLFTDVRTVGKGHFAKVKQIQHNESDEHFAAKILYKPGAGQGHAESAIEDLVCEFQMLRALRHPNIIRLYAAYESPRKCYLVTEVRLLDRAPAWLSLALLFFAERLAPFLFYSGDLPPPLSHHHRSPPLSLPLHVRAAGDRRRANEAARIGRVRLF